MSSTGRTYGLGFSQPFEREAQEAMKAVNFLIAPARFTDVYQDHSRHGLVFRGKWGTLQFKCFLNVEMIFFQHGSGMENLVRALEMHACKAIDSALAALVASEVQKQADALSKAGSDARAVVVAYRVDKVETDRYLADLQWELGELRGNVAKLYTELHALSVPWYRRLWAVLTRPL